MLKRSYRALGVMSGTSLDGVDLASINTDAETDIVCHHSETFSYCPELKQKISDLIDDIAQEIPVEYLKVLLLEQSLSHFYADKIIEFIKKFELKEGEIDVIGCHGQTIIHKPKLFLTAQLVDGNIISKRCNTDVICDFRRAHMVLGGQGAPMVPIYHKAITTHLEKPLAVVNIGGISNITWIGDKDDSMIFCDCGPGVALIDEWVKKNTNGKQFYDKDGLYAQKGYIIRPVLDKLLENDYFKINPPKSLDKKHFNDTVFTLIENLSLEDGCATLSAFTAHAIQQIRCKLPSQPLHWLFTGGGSNNPFIMSMLKEVLSCIIIDNNSNPLFCNDSMEACAFGYMAVRCKLGLPIAYKEDFNNHNKEIHPSITCGALHIGSRNS